MKTIKASEFKAKCLCITAAQLDLYGDTADRFIVATARIKGAVVLIIRPRRFETGSRRQETDHEESRADQGKTQIRLLDG